MKIFSNLKLVITKKQITLLAGFTLLSYISTFVLLLIHFMVLEHRWNPCTNTFEDIHHTHTHEHESDEPGYTSFHHHKHHHHIDDTNCQALSILYKYFIRENISLYNIPLQSISEISFVYYRKYIKPAEILSFAPKNSPPSQVC